MDSNADTHGRTSHNQPLSLRTSLLNIERCNDGLPDMIFPHDRKVEYCQNSVADEFINDSIPVLYGGGASIIKIVKHVNDVA